MGRWGEWRLLAKLLPALRRACSGRVRVKPGDDAAVLRWPGRPADLVVTTDMMVEHVHFETRWTSGEDLGHKALAVNLSDLAAMGDVRPFFGLVALGITPRTPVGFVENFYRGLRHLADRHGLDLAGGDTVRSKVLVASVMVAGLLRRGRRPVLRTGARAGDRILVTGTLGDAAAGLAIVSGRRAGTARDRAFLARRLLRPEPRLAAAARLAALGPPPSLMDSSDGFWRSLTLLCEGSGVGARVDVASLPLSASLRQWARGGQAVDLALAGGEDYELVLTAGPGAAARMERQGAARVVGEIVPRRFGLQAHHKGKPWRVPRGFEHFD
jgi:thiamine-monophosphate kinase